MAGIYLEALRTNSNRLAPKWIFYYITPMRMCSKSHVSSIRQESEQHIISIFSCEEDKWTIPLVCKESRYLKETRDSKKTHNKNKLV